MGQWQLPQLCDEQPPQEFPFTELVKPSPDLQPNVENSFSTLFPRQLGQSGFVDDNDMSCSNVCEQPVHWNSYNGIPL